jgi:transcriptional regulator of acetoin/glycerol metabolism
MTPAAVSESEALAVATEALREALEAIERLSDCARREEEARAEHERARDDLAFARQRAEDAARRALRAVSRALASGASVEEIAAAAGLPSLAVARMAKPPSPMRVATTDEEKALIRRLASHPRAVGVAAALLGMSRTTVWRMKSGR